MKRTLEHRAGCAAEQGQRVLDMLRFTDIRQA